MSDYKLRVHKDDIQSILDELRVAGLCINSDTELIEHGNDYYSIFENIVGGAKSYQMFENANLGYDSYIKFAFPAGNRKKIHSTGVLLIVPPGVNTVYLKGVDSFLGDPLIIDPTLIEVPESGEYQFLFVLIEDECDDGVFHMEWGRDENNCRTMILEYCFYNTFTQYYFEQEENL